MRVFVAGASGVIGRSVVRQLAVSGHEVIGTTRTPSRAMLVEELGAEPVVVELLDRAGLRRELDRTRPEVVVNMVTDLRAPLSFRTMDKSFTATNELRTTGTDLLLAASREAGVSRYVAQSFAGWFVEPGRGASAGEEVGLLTSPPRAVRRTVGALRHLERTVTQAEDITGTVLRFGPLYGPGTSMGTGGAILADVRRGRVPVVGGGGGIWSFTHVEDAARAVLLTVRQDGLRGVFNAVDDDPAPVATWLPYLAAVLEGPTPKPVPSWLARPAIGRFGVHVMTAVRGADNRALRERGFVPAHPSWREGFRTGLGQTSPGANRGGGHGGPSRPSRS